MDAKDIIDYVIYTPTNTNPSILNQMLEDFIQDNSNLDGYYKISDAILTQDNILSEEEYNNIKKYIKNDYVIIVDKLDGYQLCLSSSDNNNEIVLYIIGINGSNEKVTINSNRQVNREFLGEISRDEILTKTNTTPYEPTLEYHPATKKYVDDINSNNININDTVILNCGNSIIN